MSVLMAGNYVTMASVMAQLASDEYSGIKKWLWGKRGKMRWHRRMEIQGNVDKVQKSVEMVTVSYNIIWMGFGML
jgi:hypothetical protein